MSRVSKVEPASKYLADWLNRALTFEENIRAETTDATWTVVGQVAKRAQSKSWNAFLVGGALRDIALSAGRKTPRDVDIVFCDVHLNDLASEFRDFRFVRQTSFGGLRLEYRDVLVDMWPLEQTFAVNRQNQMTIEDLPKYAFLNVEAIAIEISSHENIARRIVENGFSKAIEDKIVEINFEQNPYPEISVLRAIRCSIVFNLLIGSSFVKYVRQRSWNFQKLMNEQVRHYEERIFERYHLEEIFGMMGEWDEKNGCLDLSSSLMQRENFANLFARLQFNMNVRCTHTQ